jgi:hypothetical protein
MGTFNMSVIVPNNATFGNKFISFSEESSSSNSKENMKKYNSYSMSFDFLISDPRIPTNILTFTTTKSLLKPGENLPCSLSLSTYTGMRIVL